MEEGNVTFKYVSCHVVQRAWLNIKFDIDWTIRIRAIQKAQMRDRQTALYRYTNMDHHMRINVSLENATCHKKFTAFVDSSCTRKHALDNDIVQPMKHQY